MIGQCPAISPNETVAARNGSAEATTTKLVALFKMTASSPRKQNRLISNGSRNSAPPRPIKPPNVLARAKRWQQADGEAQGGAACTRKVWNA